MPKYGVNLLLYTSSFDEDSLGFLAKAPDLGVDGVEIPIFDPETTPVDKAKELMEANSIECTTCSILGPDRDLISEDPDIRANAKKYIKDSIKISSEWSSPILCGPLYSAVGKLVGRSRLGIEWDWAVEGLKEMGDFAADHGVTLAVEPLNRFETYFINTAEDCAKLVDDVDHPNVKIHLDTFHMNIEEKSLYQAIKHVGHRLAHMHCCENDRGTPGSGNVDWDGVFKALKEIGYDGWIVVESFVPGVPEIAKAAAIWRPLAPSADVIAVEGIRFLRKKAALT
jgi:D-psicose/D-tagatose/L-ribulose 3-epimerase